MTNFWDTIYNLDDEDGDISNIDNIDADHDAEISNELDIVVGNMPTDDIVVHNGVCKACGTSAIVELANNLCTPHWDDCVDLMPHYASIDPNYDLWLALTSLEK